MLRVKVHSECDWFLLRAEVSRYLIFLVIFVYCKLVSDWFNHARRRSSISTVALFYVLHNKVTWVCQKMVIGLVLFFTSDH